MAAKGAMRLNTDEAGGEAILTQNQTVFVEGDLVMCKGDMVKPHDDSAELTPMVEGCPKIFINGIPVCREGDKAKCGHPATGSSTVFFHG